MKTRVGSPKGGHKFAINRRAFVLNLIKGSEGHLDVRSAFVCHTSSFKTFWKGINKGK
jgi:hypothetical protein